MKKNNRGGKEYTYTIARSQSVTEYNTDHGTEHHNHFSDLKEIYEDIE